MRPGRRVFALVALVLLLACSSLGVAIAKQPVADADDLQAALAARSTPTRESTQAAPSTTAFVAIEAKPTKSADKQAAAESKPAAVESKPTKATPQDDHDAQPKKKKQSKSSKKLTALRRGKHKKHKKRDLQPVDKDAASRGWGISPKAIHRRQVAQRLPPARITGAASSLTRSNVRCVMCQYIAQKLQKQLVDAKDAVPKTPALLSIAEQTRVEERVRDEANAAALAEIEATATESATASMPNAPEYGGAAPTPARFRQTDMLASRAASHRFLQSDPTDKKPLNSVGVPTVAPSATALARRDAYLKLYAAVYAGFENLCATRMPQAYLPYCNEMLQSYRYFAQGINYGDRSDAICASANYCDAASYVRRVPHHQYIREPGDA